ncbi:SseB family protein [Actinomadura geliboluensis]|uniref:SseB family protein n=1 Tax=Actinomadura geliboluensis TaxID=882440 RepID=UPI001F0F0700|nr:SseB family protein [Actinomadura geliboluensis]
MLEWSEFARRLGRELAGLERDTILIVREREESRHYVQAMREPDRLYAEAVSNNFLDGPLLLTVADEEVMSDAGWRPPADPAPRNWWTELPEAGAPGGMLGVTDGDYSRLADVMVTALRDVQGVRRPSDLVYESFHRHGTGLIELVGFGIDVADPSRVNKRRAASGGVLPEAGAQPAGLPPAGTPLPLPTDGLPSAEADLLEPRLAEAKANGDNTTYFRLLESADLVLPATASAVEDPDRAEFPTITIGGDTHVTVFTSPGALARTGDRHPGLYRRTTFARLASGWPDPAWRVAINWGLPSEVLLDSSALVRLSGGPETPPATPEEPPNPYGRVDPTALSGPNPVAGGSAPGLNGSVPGLNGSVPGLNGSVPDLPGADDPRDSYDDSHTAIDPYTVDDLRAALAAGTAEPEAREPAPAAPPLGAPTDKPADRPADKPVDKPSDDRAPDVQPPVEQRPQDQPRSDPPPAPRPAPEQPANLAPSTPPSPEPRPAGAPMRLPHGTRLWRTAGDGDETPLAVYDAIGGVWTQVRADAIPAPWTE